MEIKRLDIGIETISNIFHISDIHIRTLKRHREYLEVFENMMLEISQHADANSCCVITGDVVHSKLDMSPELVRMLTEFFNMFTIPTIVILGNHDMNLNNMHRIDALSPILDVIQNKNIHFIKENAVFEIGNVLFNHMAVDVAPEHYIRATDIKSDKYKIALHHGAVHSAKTDIGYEISNEHVKTDIFDGHDLVLLGDIHKADQTLQEYTTSNSVKKPLIKYPGSLIQQNHGEALDHGILHWNLPARTAKFMEIPNDYGYVTFETDGTTITASPKRMPKKPRVRIKFNNTDAADMKKLIATIRSKYQVQDISIQRSSSSNSGNAANNITIGNVRDVEYQNTLISDYLQNNSPDITDEELDAVRHINRTINTKLPALESVRHVTWTPMSFEFENMFSYGQHNIIDFTKISDITGLFAPNTSGKSSLLDAITYTIFDKCSKTSKAGEVLNTQKSNFRAEFKFAISDTIYTIQREGIKQKSGHVKVNVNFFTESENLNGEERSETNTNIRKYLGTYDDFILTAFSLQSDSNNFIDKSQRERKDLLSQFLDITVFEQIYQLANDEIKETAGKLRDYKKTDFAEIITNSDEIINKNKDFIINCETSESMFSTQRNDLQNEILTLIESKHATTYDGPNIKKLEQTESDLIKTIESLQDQITSKEANIDTYTDSIKTNQTKLTGYDVDFINSQVDTHNLYLETQHETQRKIKQSQKDIDIKQKKIDHLSQHEYDSNCQYCVSNVFVQDAYKAQSEIETDKSILAQLETELEEIQNKIFQTKQSVADQQDIQLLTAEIFTLKNKKEREELQLQIIENDLQTRESELETCHERQEQFHKNKTAIEFNAVVEQQIQQLKTQIEIKNSELKTISNQIKSKHGEIEVARTKKTTALEQLEKYKQLETEYRAFEYYLKSVSRNGVPYDLVALAIPKIESEINNVLNQIVDFNIVLHTDGKNINGYIIYDENNTWPLELSSGMERFISSLAIRIGLINVSALPRPNFIAIDEGWGSLDSDHISSVTNLFEYLRTKFDFSIIISHVDSMRDMVDNLLEVNKIDGFSQILHT
jgi:DNA repair exonuclease SbcCD ATPase subunit